MKQRAEQLESEAERIRAQLADSIDELRSSMSPSKIFSRLKARQQAALEGFARGVGRNLRENPLPAALAGVALTGLVARRLFSGSAERETDRRAIRLADAEWSSTRRPGPRGRFGKDRRAATRQGVLGFLRDNALLAAVLGVGASMTFRTLRPAREETRWSTDEAESDLARSVEGGAPGVMPGDDAGMVRVAAERKPCAAGRESVRLPF
jgi:hypothetical protein